MPQPLPETLQQFISQQEWIFAKTYADTYPHEYIVKERVDAELFDQLAYHIDTYGYTEHFYSKPVVYLDHDGYTYWHMGNIINRCVVADTYHRRKQDGRLPADRRAETPQAPEPDPPRPSVLPMTMGQYRHPSNVSQIQTICALRFLGYEYENSIPKPEQQTHNLSTWSNEVCETLALHADPMKNFAAFFALQRFLGKWGGESLTITSREHIAFDFLFLHLYKLDVPQEFEHAGYMKQWDELQAPDIESAAAHIRQSFRRKLDAPASLHELVINPSENA